MKRNNLISFLIALVIAFGLWLYVVTFVSVESTKTVYNIPVVFEGETVMTTDRNLMITSGENATVNLKLTGSRSDLNKVDNDNIVVKVDLTKVYDPGKHELTYTLGYPGDVPNDAFSVEKYPSMVTIVVEQKLTREIPVKIVYNGSAPEGFLVDQENALLDYTHVNVVGPSSVIEQIDHARIEVDLEDQTESISQNYRYTLCDMEDNPVDVAMVTTNVAEVHLDLKIQRFEEIPLVLTINYGGGAESHTTNISVDPKTIKVSGSEVLLEGLTELNLGTIDLATITEDTEMTFPINLPEGVTNLSGIDEAVVKISFIGLSMEEFTINQIRVINVPEGMDYELINQAIKVTLRGETPLIMAIQPEDIEIVVDLTGKEIGTATVKATVVIKNEAYKEVGAVGSYSVNVTLKQAAEDET